MGFCAQISTKLDSNFDEGRLFLLALKFVEQSSMDSFRYSDVFQSRNATRQGVCFRVFDMKCHLQPLKTFGVDHYIQEDTREEERRGLGFSAENSMDVLS